MAVPHATDDYATGTGCPPQVGATRQISPDEEKRATVLEGEICLFASLRDANKTSSRSTKFVKRKQHEPSKWVRVVFVWWNAGIEAQTHRLR